jgi:hypothetical protein
MNRKENPTPRANAGRTHQAQDQDRTPNTTRGETLDFATVYVALRYRLPLPVASVIARLAELGGAPS